MTNKVSRTVTAIEEQIEEREEQLKIQKLYSYITWIIRLFPNGKIGYDFEFHMIDICKSFT